ncbi:MAG: hypothetical protein IKM03_07970 [Alistipes sp.]|nr:hypothetical protein [Alistipes sp.]
MVQTKNLWSSLLRDLFIGVTIFAGVITYGFLNPDIDMNVEMPIWAATTISIVVCILSIAGAIWVHGYCTRCPHCRKKYAMVKQNKQKIDTDFEQNAQNETYKVTTFHTRRKCKYCNEEDYIESKKKDKVR